MGNRGSGRGSLKYEKGPSSNMFGFLKHLLLDIYYSYLQPVLLSLKLLLVSAFLVISKFLGTTMQIRHLLVLCYPAIYFLLLIICDLYICRYGQ